MPPARPLPLAPVVVAAALLVAVPGLWHLGDELVASATLAPWLPSPLALLACLLVGRTVLALLPPGFPGEHGGGAHQDSGGLTATLAASLLLGVALLPVQAELHRRLGLADGALALVLPWLLPLALRLVSLPGAMVPRHGQGVPGSRGALDAALLVAAVVLALAPAVLALALEVPVVAPWTMGAFGGAHLASPTDDPLVGLACLPALVVLVQHGLGGLGAPTWLRRAGGLLLATTPLVLATALVAPGSFGAAALSAEHELAQLAPALPRAALALGGATALALTALVRADRRAGLMAVLGFLSLAWLVPVSLPAAGPALAIAGLASLLLAAPGGLRQRLAWPLGLGLFLAPAVGLMLLASTAVPSGAPEPSLDSIDGLWALLEGYDTLRFGLLFALIDAAWIVAALLRPWTGRPGRPGGRAGRRPCPALLFLFVAATLSLLMTLALELLLELAHPWLAPRFVDAVPELLLLLLPGGLLLLVAVLAALTPHRTTPAAGPAR